MLLRFILSVGTEELVEIICIQLGLCKKNMK